MKRGFLAAGMAVGILAAGAAGIVRADDLADKIRTVAVKHQSSLGVLKGVVELKISMNGQVAGEQEVPVEFPAFAVNAGGLFVTSDPENESTYQGNIQPGVSLEAHCKDYKIVLPSGVEHPARVEGVDSEYGLAFVRLETPIAGLAVPPMAGDRKLAMGDPFVTIRLLSAARPEVVVDITRVDHSFEKPAPMFRFSSMTVPVASPAFDLEGNLVGLTCIYRENRAGGQAVPHQVVLPTKRLSELVASVKPAATEEKK